MAAERIFLENVLNELLYRVKIMVKHKIEVISTNLVEKISDEAAFLASILQILNPWISDKMKSKKTIRNSLKSFHNV